MTKYSKAIYAFVSTLISSLILVVDNGITVKEGLLVAQAVVIVTAGVFGITNQTPPVVTNQVPPVV